jgi:hypothetical protein
MLLRIYLPHYNSVKPYRIAAIYQPLKPKVVVQAVVAMVEVDEVEVKVVAEEGIYTWAVTALINGGNYHLQIKRKYTKDDKSQLKISPRVLLSIVVPQDKLLLLR